MNKKNFSPKIYPLDQDLNKVWFVKYYEHGRPLKKYGNLKNYPTVEGRLAEAERMVQDLLSPADTTHKHNNLSQHLYDHLIWIKPSVRFRTYQTYISIVNLFTTWYQGEKAKNNKVNPVEFIRYLHVNEHHVNHISKVAGRMKCWFAVLVKNGLVEHNPFADTTVRKIKGRSKLPFHTNQVQQLKTKIAAEDPQLLDAIMFEYYLYFRPKEIRLLKVGDILFDEWQVILRAEVSKDKEDLEKSIPLAFRETIAKYQGYPPEYFIFSAGGEPGPKCLSVNNLNYRHSKFMKVLRYPSRFTLYSWVHTGIKFAALKGIPLVQLQLQKGHSDLEMFAEYLKDLNVLEDCREMVDNFPAM